MSDCCGQHWGEIPPRPDLHSGIAAVEKAKLVASEPIDLTIDLDHKNRDICSSNDVIECQLKDVPIGNPVVLHTIKLLQFSTKLNDTNVRQKLSHESVPQLMTTNEMHSKELNVFTIQNKNLNQKAIKCLLRRAVIITAVFHGYHFTNESVIDLLVDILSQFLSHLCQTIRTTSDSLELMSSNDFIDVIDRVFHDLNVSDFESLRQYDSDLRLYNQNLLKEVNKKIGINESMNSCNKISNTFQMDSNSDNSPQLSVTTHSDVKGVDTTLSLKSLLSTLKTNNTEETEQLFDLTSLTNKGTES